MQVFLFVFFFAFFFLFCFVFLYIYILHRLYILHRQLIRISSPPFSIFVIEPSQLALFINIQRAVIGPSATLTDR